MTTTSVLLNGEQHKNALTIVQTGFQMGATLEEIIGALAAAWSESRFHANARVLDTNGKYSIGLFQQQDSYGTVANRLDPVTAARAFYKRLFGTRTQSGLEPNVSIGVRVHRVQRNADPNLYTNNLGIARAIATQLGNAGYSHSTDSATGALGEAAGAVGGVIQDPIGAVGGVVGDAAGAAGGAVVSGIGKLLFGSDMAKVALRAVELLGGAFLMGGGIVILAVTVGSASPVATGAVGAVIGGPAGAVKGAAVGRQVRTEKRAQADVRAASREASMASSRNRQENAEAAIVRRHGGRSWVPATETPF